MAKIRLIRTSVVEYEPDFNYYPEGYTVEQMAEYDSKVDDRELLFEECVSDEVTYEIVEGE